MKERNTAQGPATNGLGAIVWSTPVISAPTGLAITSVILPSAEKLRVFAIATAGEGTVPTNPVATTTSLSLSAATVVAGESGSVTASVVVQGLSGSGNLGTVSIMDGEETILANLAPDSRGSVTAPLPGDLGVGEHALRAVFTPTDPAAYGSSTSPIGALTVTAKQTPPVERTEVVPGGVVFADRDGSVHDTYTVPATDGVDYLVDGRVVSAGPHAASGTVTVTARAREGFVITSGAQTVWSHEFSAATAGTPTPSPSSSASSNSPRPSGATGTSAGGRGTGTQADDLARTGSTAGSLAALAALSLLAGAAVLAARGRRH